MSKLTEIQKSSILELSRAGVSSRKIAERVLGSKSKKSTVNDFLSRWGSKVSPVSNASDLSEKKKPVIKVVDVETAPEVVYTFRRFKAFISPEQVIKRGYLLSYSSADLYTGEVEGRNLTHYPAFSEDVSDDFELTRDLWQLLDSSDIIIAHNGIKFDKAYISQRMAFHGFPPPSPYIVVDTLRAFKKTFALPSNALKEGCLYFETENFKLDNEGFSLWKACHEGDVDAFGRMQTYNDGDVLSLRDLYLRILAWIPQHPNLSAYYEDDVCRCPRCGSTDITLEDGKQYHTNVSSFEVIRCNSCKGLSRARVNLRSKDKLKNTIIGV